MPKITAETAITLLRRLAQLEAQYVSVMAPVNPQGVPALFQKGRDQVLHDYLNWTDLKAQYDTGRINFEEFITGITYTMMEILVHESPDTSRLVMPESSADQPFPPITPPLVESVDEHGPL